MPCSCSSSCFLFIYFYFIYLFFLTSSPDKDYYIHLFFFLFRTSCKSRFESEFELLSTLAISFFFSALGEMNYVFFFLSGKLWGLSHVDILNFILVFVVVVCFLIFLSSFSASICRLSSPFIVFMDIYNKLSQNTKKCLPCLLTYPRPKDCDHDDEVSYDGEKSCGDKATDRRHAWIKCS